MIRSLWLAALVFAFVGTTLTAAAQKKGNPNRDCPNGTKEIARFEDTADIVPGKTIDGVTISDTTETAEDELSGGEWNSSVDLVALVIKGGGGQGGARPGQYVFFEPSRTGTFSNSVLDGQEISNLKFCGSKTSCPFSDFTEEVNYEESRVEITIEDTEGIDGLSFTDDDGNPLLNNLEVELVRAVDENGEVPFTSTSGQIDWQATGDHPTRVEMYLNQEDLGNPQVGYFLRTTNGCGTLTYIDPERTIDRFPEEGLDVSGSFPNPFQQRTTIQFSLSDRSPVTISVYDVLGRQVATLVDRTLAAGAHEVQWDGRSSTGQPVSSGLYLYRVEVGPYSETRRMTLVR
jgi:hypothetical protein